MSQETLFGTDKLNEAYGKINRNFGELYAGAGGGGGGATNLNELTDVTITSVANNQALVYNNVSNQWENQAIPRDLEALSDVDLTSPTTNQLLKYNGTQFVNAKANIGELGDVVITGTPVNGSILVYNTALSTPVWENQPNTNVLKVNYRQDEVQRYEFAQMEVF
jgi:hypothetical protein